MWELTRPLLNALLHLFAPNSSHQGPGPEHPCLHSNQTLASHAPWRRLAAVVAMVTGAGAGPRAGRVRGERARGPSAVLDMALRRRPSLVLLLLLVRGESAGLRQTRPEGTRRGERVWWRGGPGLRAAESVREGSRG